MKTIKQTYLINSSLPRVWQALTNPRDIENWGGGPAKMDDKKGTGFSLWGGSIWGRNIEIIPGKKLAQEWYSDEKNKWDKPSIAIFTLSKVSKGVKLELVHKDIPDENVKDIDGGWKEYYLGPLKEYLEKHE